MDSKWIKFDFDSDGHYPPEGVEVAVTDGHNIDVMWLIYSGGPEWCWYNIEDPDGFSNGEVPFQPIYWKSEEDSIPYIREKKLKMVFDGV